MNYDKPKPSEIAKNSIEALSIKFNTAVYEKQAKGEDVIVLSLGEAFFQIPLFSFEKLPLSKIYHYSHSRGIPELRRRLIKHHKDMHDIDFKEDEIIVTSGSKIAIHMSLMSILNPGDEVIIHEPAWVSYPEEVKLCYGVPIFVPYNKTVFDFGDFITKKTKMIIINNPNNPTGKIYSEKELSYVYDIAKKHNLMVLSDEAYSDFLYNTKEFVSFSKIDNEKKYSIVINSMSKNFGMSGWRIGYVITNSEWINEILKINQHLITCPATILEYYLTSYFTEIINITRPQIIHLLDKRIEIAKFMDSLSLEYIHGESTFYFFVSISDSNLTSEQFCLELLEKDNISTVPGIGYGKSCDDFIRVSIGTEPIDRIMKGLHSIKKLIDETNVQIIK